MPLGLSDLDPSLAERLNHHVTALYRDTFASPPILASDPSLRAAQEEIRTKGTYRDSLVLFIFAVFVLLASFLTFFFQALGLFDVYPTSSLKSSIHPNYPLLITSFIISAITALYLKSDISKMTDKLSEHLFDPDIISAAIPTLQITEIERIYLESIPPMISAQQSVGEGTARELLSALNDLLTAARRLEAEKSTLDAAMARQSLAQIESERDRLQARIEASSDAVARETLAENLKLCETRLVRAWSLAPLQERIDAQLFGIAQTMRSVQSSVATLKLAPSTSADLDALRETARELAGRTRAIEDAVREVISIRS